MRDGANRGIGRFQSRWFASLALMVVGMAQAADQLPPADEGPRDASLVAFRTKLIAAVEKHDVEFLRSIVDPAIAVATPNDGGAKAFFARWQPERADSQFWPLLKNILAMGGAYVRSDDGVQFCAPYVFTHFPSELDVTGHAVLIQKGVSLRRGPALTATSVQTPDYAILKVKDWRSVADQGGDRNANWLKVVGADGGEAYARHDWVRGPNDYHACFLSGDTRWRMVSFAVVR